MPAVVHLPGEGEALFDGRILLLCDLEELCITESWFVRARPGADPHVHGAHSDSFYVLEGELAFLVDDEEHLLGPGACVCAPPGLVHGFRSLSPARFLNFHTPDGGFAANLRALNRGEPGGFDSVDAEPGSGLPGSDGILFHAGEGERLPTDNCVATIKIGCETLSLTEVELDPGFEGSELHSHDDHTDAFYVLSGEVLFQLDESRFVAGPGTFVAATPGVAHTFTSGPEGGRLLNMHAPGTGLHDQLGEVS